MLKSWSWGLIGVVTEHIVGEGDSFVCLEMESLFVALCVPELSKVDQTGLELTAICFSLWLGSAGLKGMPTTLSL